MDYKTPTISKTVMTEMVMPNDTNPLHNLMGGNLMRWMDVAGGICARRHAERVCVTASVDTVSFKSPIKLGEIVTIIAKVTRVFTTSLEIHIEVFAEGVASNGRRKSNEAYFTFVSVDEYGNKLKVPQLATETPEEEAQYESAMRRREMRLILAKRMKPEQSTALKALFLGKE